MKTTHQRLRCIVGVLSLTLCLALFFFVPVSTHAATAPIKIMPLGDSITYGTNSSNGGGYRLPLWNDLISQGASVDFVGSQQSGPMNADDDNEGHPGWRIDQIASNIVSWLTTYQPQIILLHIGTNDINQNYDVANAPARLSSLIHQITTTLPNASVFVAQIIPLTSSSSSNSQVVTYNSAIPNIVQAAGPNVHMVDMYDAVPANQLPDNIHPSDFGYALMAHVWYTALLPLLSLNSQAQQFATNFENALPQPTSSNLGDTSGYPAGGIANVTGVCCGLAGPESGTRNEIAYSGTTSLMYSGDATASSGADFAYMVGFDVSALNLVVDSSARLSYWIYPQSPRSNTLTTGTNSSCVAIDLIFSDGSNLRDSGAVDQNGNRAHPAYQCNHLALDSWNQVIVQLGSYVNGKTVERIDVGYDQPNTTGGYRGYVDDISIAG